MGSLTSCGFSITSRRRELARVEDENSTLGLKKPTLRPWHTIYYYLTNRINSIFFYMFISDDFCRQKILSIGNMSFAIKNFSH